jgi:hypothetical protein
VLLVTDQALGHKQTRSLYVNHFWDGSGWRDRQPHCFFAECTRQRITIVAGGDLNESGARNHNLLYSHYSGYRHHCQGLSHSPPECLIRSSRSRRSGLSDSLALLDSKVAATSAPVPKGSQSSEGSLKEIRQQIRKHSSPRSKVSGASVLEKFRNPSRVEPRYSDR